MYILVLPVEVKIDPELKSSIDIINQEIIETRGELSAIHLQMSDIHQRVETLSGSTISDMEIRAKLPPEYLEKVDRFFENQSAALLLSPALQKNKNISFGTPMFISFDTITVPYSTSSKQSSLIVQITILDYYDLKFDAIWDGMEGG